MESVISIENLGKKYRLNHKRQEKYLTLRDLMVDKIRFFNQVFLKNENEEHSPQSTEDFWALKDISLNIEPGERVGVIGRNGAGKSTLLKVLSRITEPTSGVVRIKGKVASLLEVGTGFHPELTGRENIYLNGAILGMSREEINRKFDKIVDFAEVERFLDTPVKRYSSGMYVRLAFSVAAHLDTDILIVDEVLAVGDAGFQKKCMDTMQSVAKDTGRTVIFVSHNLGAVNELCTKAVLLQGGKIAAIGSTDNVIPKYLSTYKSHENNHALEYNPLLPIYATKVYLFDLTDTATQSIELGEDGLIEIYYTIKEPLNNVCVALMVSRLGSSLLYSYDIDVAQDLEIETRSPGEYLARIKLPLSNFKEGQYSIAVKFGVGQSNMTDERAVFSFEIINTKLNTTHKSYREDRPGHLYIPLKWDTVKL